MSTPPPYGPPPGYGPPAGYGPPTPRPSTGVVAWAMGFLTVIPAVGLLVAAIVMVAVYPAVRRHGPVAQGNARGAANWGLTVIVAIVVSIALAIVLNIASGNHGFFPTGWGIVLIVVTAVVHLVTTIVGTVRASGGRVFSPAYAIPFLRR